VLRELLLSRFLRGLNVRNGSHGLLECWFGQVLTSGTSSFRLSFRSLLRNSSITFYLDVLPCNVTVIREADSDCCSSEQLGQERPYLSFLGGACLCRKLTSLVPVRDGIHSDVPICG
jgi:hypothetical protein